MALRLGLSEEGSRLGTQNGVRALTGVARRHELVCVCVYRPQLVLTTMRWISRWMSAESESNKLKVSERDRRHHGSNACRVRHRLALNEQLLHNIHVAIQRRTRLQQPERTV